MALKANVQGHHKLLDEPQFELSVQYAMLQYNAQLCEQNVDMGAAAGNHFKMRGAQEFLHVLRMLAESPRMPAPAPSGNLPFNQ